MLASSAGTICTSCRFICNCCLLQLLQLLPWLLKLPEPKPGPERPQIIQEPEPSKAEPKSPVHEDGGSLSSRVGDPIDHQSRASGSGQKPAPTPVEESQKQPVEPFMEGVVTEKSVNAIERNGATFQQASQATGWAEQMTRRRLRRPTNQSRKPHQGDQRPLGSTMTNGKVRRHV
jgi:hypothetical protein